MRGSTAALMAAALLMLLVSPALLMLLVSPAAPDTYEQEARRMFVEWKAKNKMTYKYAGEEECRYAVFRSTRCRVARANAAGRTPSGLNGLSGYVSEEVLRGHGVRTGEKSYEEETRRMFVGWKAKYGKTYRDAGEELCRYMLFKANRRFVVKLNAAAAGETAYGLNQFGDLADEEVRGCYDGRGEEMGGKLSARCHERLIQSQEGKLSARCQAAVAGDTIYERLIQSQVCRCVALELKQTESGGSVIPGDEAHMWI
ncbi:uncharacterized protein LOC120713042 [Panicum virgatum]|uniref:Cathepsin propeptide inhibitor domain-containing protein n=1 Tax=Panicum virgatum TaxID=38727 RepID=A0A8T0RH63_PANVG|nr:uncharacterized protein LOC120713042 [Panicum virgatum]KAG2585412.1 hypothetical protein PVAP13_6KG388500 [Panicum virgatum]